MQFDPSSSVPPALAAPAPQPFLIPPAKRLSFICGLTLATVLAGLVELAFKRGVAGAIAVDTLSDFAAAIWRYTDWAISSFVLGLAQWVILRQYGLTHLWIVATGMGGLIAQAVGFGWQAKLGLVLSRLAYVWLGLAQGFVLRRDVRSAWLWLFVPPVTFVLSSLLFLVILGQTPTGIAVGLPGPSYVALIPALTLQGLLPAIALCGLRQKGSSARRPSSEAAFRATPEMTDLTQLRSLARELHTQLTQTDIPEIAEDQDLIYLVDMTVEGAIAMYQPVNQAAFDYADQTPLPALAEAELAGQAGQANQEKYGSEVATLARFQVIFQATGDITIRSSNGEPLS
ncbi:MULTISPECIES: hypothetical protein [Trichocoleus]|uniref:Uncharacterized protein n=1 Tax=Trichocoleus desertorum GB2-A4 TaxID=2933944 RepID=A0ABV0J4D5_9CYAN|nr:hypothetical protein [Trichocoleus sp. FACHB-46]MBD1861859.1 hypothetical protein [Trichocoleus sp. FACHB-46]